MSRAAHQESERPWLANAEVAARLEEVPGKGARPPDVGIRDRQNFNCHAIPAAAYVVSRFPDCGPSPGRFAFVARASRSRMMASADARR